MVKNEFSPEEQARIDMAINQLHAKGYDADVGWGEVQRRMRWKRRAWRKRLLYRCAAVVILFTVSGLAFWLYSGRQDLPLAGKNQILPLKGQPELI